MSDELQELPAFNPVSTETAPKAPAPAPNIPPATSDNAPKKGPNVLHIVLIGIVCLVSGMLIMRNIGSRPDDGGTSPSVVVDQTEAVTRDFAQSLAVAVRSTADAVRDGQITNWQQLAANSNERTKAAREKAFMPLNELANDHIPAGEWDTDAKRQRVITYLNAVADGHERAAQ